MSVCCLQRDKQQFLSLQPSSSSRFRPELEEHQARFNGLNRDEPGSVANARLPRIGAHMRSELVYSAGLKIENRFLLSATVMRAVRKLHVSSGRTEDTVNRVFAEVAEGRYVDVELPEIAPPPPIDELVVAPLV
jgi:hypothetical protein